MTIHRLLISVSIAALFVACATVKETYSPDGRKAYTLNCSGTARGWDKCYVAAGELCKESGYDIIERSSESMVGSSVKTNERSMLIACKRK